MRKLKSKIIMAGLFIGFTSCTTTRVAMLSKTETEKVELFTTRQPERKYVEISYLQVDGSVFNTPQKLLNGLKKKADEMKADAIINIKYDFQAWYPIASGTAIKYID